MVQFTANSYPVRIHSGQQALHALPAEFDRCATQRAFIVCGRSLAARSNLIDRIRSLVGERVAGMHESIGKDAPVEDVLEAVRAARACGADMLLAVGAGSVIKATRVIAILLAEQKPIDQLITRYPDGAAPVSPRLNAPKLPIINILTAATSAQNRAGAALKNAPGEYRMEFFDPKTRPRAIFWDADALLTAPPALALSTGISVYWRALMNIGSIKQANPLVQASRYQAFHLAQCAIGRVTNQDDYQARIDLCAAALMQNRDEDDGGRPFDTHWIARVVYALSTATFNLVPGIDQGQASAVLTGVTIRHFGSRCLEETIAIGRALNAWRDEAEPAQAPALIGQAVDDLFCRLGMPGRLRDLNVGREQLSDILRLSLMNFNADRERSFLNNQDLLGAVLREAW
jgi:alcohol dehydrogenase class IV